MTNQNIATGKPAMQTARSAFTLMEMLVVVTIIGVLASLMFPALNAARESSRRVSCQNNLRQIGIGLSDHAARHQAFCSGSFDFRRDGCVTEVGWVADLIDTGIPAGELLCPSNSSVVSESYNDLMNLMAADPCACITIDDMAGSQPGLLPDGTLRYNPCRYIIDNPNALDMTAGAEDRRMHVEAEVFDQHYNTNYTASWILVRSGPLLTPHGNLETCVAGCESINSLGSTAGPLTLRIADGAACPLNFIPLMACGGPGELLQYPFGEQVAGTPTAKSLSRGPILTMDVPSGMGVALSPPGPFSEADPSATPPEPGTPRDGPLGTGWWAAWNLTLQDYRDFGPVHRYSCNILFADGSVRNYVDQNHDGLLNNGFTIAGAPNSGFLDDEIDLPQEEVFSGWVLQTSYK